MDRTSIIDLLAEIRRRGIIITGYAVDHDAMYEQAWARRRHAVMAWHAAWH